MNEFFNRIVTQIREMWNNLSKQQRIWAGGIGLTIFAALILLSIFVNRTVFVPLGTFEVSASAAIRAELERAGFRQDVDYRITNEGRTILIDARKRNDALLTLSGQGLMGTTEKGFSIFDEFDITTTDYEQRIRNIEALKSEMRRLIRSYSQVEDVNINVPYIENENIFSDKEVSASATVVLTLKPGAKLDDVQIRAIRGAIAASFPGLTDEKISLTDNQMNPLMAADEDAALHGMGDKQIGIVKSTARGLDDAIRKVLGPVLGQDKFTVSVNVEFDWDNVQIAQQQYSSPGFDQLMESSQSEDEKLTGQGLRPGGEPGTSSNAPPVYNSIANVGPVDYSRSEKIVNYLADKTVTERIQSPFVKRITAAVAIDGVWRERTDTEGKTVRVYEARTAAEMEQLSALVQSAIGEKPDRQDNIQVRNVPYDREKEFARLDAAKIASEFERKMVLYSLLMIPLLMGLAFLYAMWRKSVRLREEELARQRELDRQRALASAEAGLAGEISLEDQERQEIQRRATSLARAKPQVVAELLRTWMAEEPPPA